MALFSLSLRCSRIMRRGKYILFVLGRRATILPLQCLLFAPEMCEYGQTYNKQLLYLVPNLRPLGLAYPLHLQILILQDLRMWWGLSSCSMDSSQPSMTLSPHCHPQTSTVPVGAAWVCKGCMRNLQAEWGPAIVGKVKRDTKKWGNT